LYTPENKWYGVGSHIFRDVAKSNVLWRAHLAHEVRARYITRLLRECRARHCTNCTFGHISCIVETRVDSHNPITVSLWICRTWQHIL
jgi:hypothetical protein